MALEFPLNPTIGQLYIGDNTVTYQYTGDRWSTAIPFHNGLTAYVYEGGTSEFVYIPPLDNVIDGGTA